MTTEELPAHFHKASVESASLTGEANVGLRGVSHDVPDTGIMTKRNLSMYQLAAGTSTDSSNWIIGVDASHTHNARIESTGEGQRHENRPPYETVQRWKRTA